MTYYSTLRFFSLLPLCLALAVPTTRADLVQENWDYPAIADNTQVSAGQGFTGGSNWNGAEWARENVAPYYQTDLNLALGTSVRGWVDANAATSGAIAGPTGDANGTHTQQAFRRISASELTGTTYLAFLFAGSGYVKNAHAAVFFDGDTDIPRGMMGLSFMQDATFSYTATTTQSVRNSTGTKGTFGRIKYSTVGGTPVPNLVIAKFETNYNAAGHDRVTCILNPSDVRSEELALLTAGVINNAGVFIYDPGTDLWGDGINPELAISMRGGITSTIDPIVDQIRIATGTDGWESLVAPSGQPPITPEPGGVEYLDTRPYDLGLDRGGQDPLEHGILFQNQTDTGAPIVIDGTTPAHGLFTRETRVELNYFLTGEYSGFAADLWRVGATPSFQVVGDGEVLYDSGVLLVGERRRVLVDVSGVTKLTLVFADGGDGINNDKMSLGNPRLIKKPVLALNAWEQWRATHFPDALDQSDTVSGPEALSGGTPNAIRFALGLTPNDDIQAVLPWLQNDRLTMAVPTANEAADLYQAWVQVSGNLTDWTDLTPPTAQTIDGEELRVFQDTVSVSTAAKRFMRFKAAFKNPVARIATDLVSGIAPLTVAFDGSASSAPNSVYRYNWNFGDGASEALAPSPSHTFTDPGVYETTLEVYDDADRIGVSRVTITVLSPENQPPSASLVASSRLVTPGTTVTFDATASSDVDGSIASYLWDFGGGDTATGAQVTRTFNATGIVPVTLTVTDDDGATNTASSRVRIDTGDNSTILPIRQGSRILVIGNSLMGFYGPLREALAACTVASNPSFSIEHGGAGKGLGILVEYATWSSLAVEDKINQGWDIVIIQPWTDVRDADRTTYEAAADTLVGWVRASGAEPVFIIPHYDWQYWPTYQPLGQSVITATATRLGTSLIDVTPAWNQVLADYPMAVDGNNRLVDTASTDEFKDLLYSDSVHQNANGMALNTYLVYKYLTGKSPVGLSPAWPNGMSGINNALQPYLQGVANTHGTVSPFIPAP